MQIRETEQTWYSNSNVYSQNGEDGIIKDIFDKISTRNKFVVECGALNGIHDSNARILIEQGWGGLMIEADKTAYEKLVFNYKNFGKVSCLNRFISFEGQNSFDSIFEQNSVPNDLDLFILDIDGNEYHVWEGIKNYRPRVVVIEFNPTIPNEVEFIQPRDMSIQQGSSLLSLKKLGDEKQYRLVAVTDVNGIFVRAEDSLLFEDYENNLSLLRSNNEYETKLFQLYDGTLKISGNKRLIWHDMPILEHKLQVLSKKERFFRNGISEKSYVRTIKHFFRNTPIYPLIKKLRRINFFRRILR